MIKICLRLAFIFILLAILTWVLGFINSKNQPKHIHYLPDSSKLLFVINTKSFANNIMQIACFNQKDFQSLISEEAEGENILLKEGNPGIDLNSKATILIDDKQIYLFADLKNKLNFEKFLQKKSFVIQNRAPYFFASNNHQQILYNNEILICQLNKTDSDTEKKMASWLAQKNTLSEKIIADIYESEKQLELYYLEDNNHVFDVGVVFDKDAITINACLTYTGNINNEIICTGDISFFEKNNFAIYSSQGLLSVKIEELLPKEVSSIYILKKLFQTHNKQSVYAYANDVVSSHIYLTKSDKTVSDYKKLPFYMPVLRLAYSIDSKELIMQDLNAYLNDTVLIKHANYYQLMLPGDYSLYFKIFDKHLAISVDTNFITQIPRPEETGFSYFYYSSLENYTNAIPTFSPDGFMIKSFLEMKSTINRIYIYATHRDNNKIYFTGKIFIGDEQYHSLIETIKILQSNLSLL